jgi:hypothetical protein
MLELSFDETTDNVNSGDNSNKDNPYLTRPTSEVGRGGVEMISAEPGPLNSLSWKAIEKPMGESANDIATQVAKLNASGNAAVHGVVGTALKYLENAKREPWTAKFRSFKLSNKIVDRITKVERSLDLLCSLGLYVYASESDFMVCIPVAGDLEEMEKDMKDLLAAFPQQS